MAAQGNGVSIVFRYSEDPSGEIMIAGESWWTEPIYEWDDEEEIEYLVEPTRFEYNSYFGLGSPAKELAIVVTNLNDSEVAEVVISLISKTVTVNYL